MSSIERIEVRARELIQLLKEFGGPQMAVAFLRGLADGLEKESKK